MFHSNLSKVLMSQINASSKTLIEDKNEIIDEMAIYNNKIDLLHNGSGISPQVMERLEKITSELETYKKENKNFELKNDISIKLKESKEEKNNKKIYILDKISGQLNYKMNEISQEISKGGTSPTLICSETKYKFENFLNTGTGKAYENFIIYDLAILELTELPMVAHDSPLIKNIELLGTENLLKRYNKFTEKQIFISIDELERYNEEIKKIILDSTIIEVSKEKPLFGKIWG